MLLNKTLNILEYESIKKLLLELSSCELAKNMIRELEPETDCEIISQLLTETEDAVNFIIKRGMPPMAGVHDIRPSVRRAASGGSLSFAELLRVSGLLRAARRMSNYASSVEIVQEDTISAYISQIIQNRYFEEKINRCIISEEEIADEASPELFSIRRQISSVQNSIKDKLNNILKSNAYSKSIQESVVTMREGRYCIPVKVEHRGEINGIVHDTSSSGQTLFIEPAFVVEANNKIRELKIKEAQEIDRIVSELSFEVGENESVLNQDLKIISYLDFTFAKARLALDQKAIRPIINESGKINIIKARHPLIPKDKIVPISIYLNEKECMVITGPNTGGKTVALKTVGLLTLMMQSGLLIPADDKSELSIFTGIFADIGDEQSISQSLSTFSAHMKNIVSILAACDDRSLILLDELGAGTDPTEGAALAMSILEFLHLIGASVFATTHYSELKVFASTTPGFINASCEFDTQTLRPTYKLLIGVPGKSNAFAISEKLGLESNIILRAKEFLTNEDLRFEDMLKDIESNRKAIDSQKEETQQLRAEAERLREEIAQEKEKFIQEKNELINKTKEEARVILSKARVSADKLLSEIRKSASEIEKTGRTSDAVRNAENASREFREFCDETEAVLYNGYSRGIDNSKPPKTLKEGQSVKILSLNNKATVLKAPDKDGNVYVQAGIMKMYIHISDLRIAEEEKKSDKATNKYVSIGVSGKAATIKSEIDVRGTTVDEAMIIIDRHIHEAFLAKQSQFSIIHGKGTGALRAGIHNYLRTCKQIKSFRIGAYGEGDAGVTVVTLR